MAGSNTENTIEVGCGKPAETPKQTLLNSFIAYTEYHNEELLYSFNALEKRKKGLEIIRSKKDIQLRKNQSFVVAPVDGEPKHKVFKIIKNEDAIPVLSFGKDQGDFITIQWRGMPPLSVFY